MDISKVKVGSTTYNVKDTTARDNSVHYVTSPSGTSGTKDVNRTIWTGTVDGVTSLYTGLTVIIKVPLAGVNKGVVLNINNLGEHPVVHNVNSILTTHYSVGTMLHLVYDADQAATVMVSGTNTSITGCWKLSLYDSNTDVQMRLYKQLTNSSTWNNDYPIIASRTLSSSIAETDGKYVSIYGLIGSSSVNPTVNPITGDVKVKSLTLNGTTLESKTAAESGTDISLVTTGEKAVWNAKLSASSTLDATKLSGTIPSSCYTDNKVRINKTNPTRRTDYYLVWHTSESGTDSLNANDGLRYYVEEGTTSSEGSADLVIGNNKTSTTDKNKTGSIYIFGNKNKYVRFLPGNLTSNKTYTLPDKTGTLAMISDIPSTMEYSAISYTVNATSSAGGTLSLDGTTPLHVVTLTGNVSALTLSSNPSAGHSCHVIFTADDEYTVAIAHDATNRVCPSAEDVSLNVPAGGYVEIDFLTANSKVYVRGV